MKVAAAATVSPHPGWRDTVLFLRQPHVRMSTFASKYCAATRCPESAFTRTVLSQSLYPTARLLSPLINLLSSSYFGPDRALVDAVGRCTSMDAVREEVHHFFISPDNTSWMRTQAKVRVSTQRLMHLASRHLKGEERPSRSGSRPPGDGAA